MPSAAEIRELDDEELENKLLEARKELFNLRFQAATGRLDNNARVDTGPQGHRTAVDRAARPRDRARRVGEAGRRAGTKEK